MPSSVIDHFSYDLSTKTLVITFVTGMAYHYLNVPQKIHLSLKAASSKGSYFNFYIKDKFKFEKFET